MYAPLALAIMLASLVVGAWCFVPVTQDRFLGRSHLYLIIVLELAVVVQAVIATIRLIAGDHPVELVTFIGYLLTSVLFLPAALSLSFMERTRWGSVIAGSAALVVAVLTLRLQQVWTPLQ